MNNNNPKNNFRKSYKKQVIICLLFLVGFIFPSQMMAQSQTITLSVTNENLQSVFDKIEKTTEYRFTYKDVVLPTEKNISVSVKDKSIEAFLSQVLAPTHLTYKRTGNSFAIISQPAQNEKTISGIVTDNIGEPIIGVNVVEKATKKGTTTNVNGQYTLNVSENATLQFNYLGYVAQEILVGQQTNINITLKEDTQTLDEVVVIGYGSIAKREVTSAISHVSSKDFLKIGAQNPAMAIQGKVSGLTISNTASADPNSSADMQLRGVASREAGHTPLIVIDGVPGGDLWNINENDIESIDVLKDGAASAIYGTQGSTGVIMITTKKGNRDGQSRMTYSGYLTANVPILDVDVLGAKDFVAHGRGQNYGADTDWLNEITQTGFTQSHTLQANGGNAKNSYNVSVDYKKGEGVDIRSSREEYGARLNLNHEGRNGLYNLTFNVAPRHQEWSPRSDDMFRQALTLNPSYPVMNPELQGIYQEVQGLNAVNPVEELRIHISDNTANILEWNGTFKLNLLPFFLPSNPKHALSTQVMLAQKNSDAFSGSFTPSTSTQNYKYGTSGRYTNTAGVNRSNNFTNNLEWLVNYAFSNDGHNLKALGGYSYQYNQSSFLSASNMNFTSDALLYNNLQDGTYQRETSGRLGFESGKEDSKLIGYFGRVSYDYEGKYLATASIRREGSSKFGKNHKWGNFPAVSAGWRISQEDFLKDISWINDLKIRADYGVTGNQAFGNYRSLATKQSGGWYPWDGNYIMGWYTNGNVNENLKWEVGKNLNIGVDYSLFDNRLNGNINYFHRKQEDILGNYPVPMPPNVSSTMFANVGSMLNQGVELDINIDVVRSKDFSYTVGLIGSAVANKFLSFSNDIFTGQKYYEVGGFPNPNLTGSAPPPISRIVEGERVGIFFMYEYAGVDANGEWQIKDNQGNVKLLSAAGGDIDKKIMGNGLPKFNLSWNNTFRYKSWDLTAFFRGAFGFDIYDSRQMYWGIQNSAQNTNVFQSAYTTNGHIKSPTTSLSYFLHNGNYLKLDVLTLGYTLNTPNNKILDGARIYCTGRNLFTMRAYNDGADPDLYNVNGLEVGVLANKYSYYPSARQFLVGLQLNF
jgi:TonB-linked SusC/RagA family outer membrane protein